MHDGNGGSGYGGGEGQLRGGRMEIEDGQVR
jgi:hypothetical protein